MSTCLITRDEVIGCSKLLPVFPSIVNKILDTLDDPAFNLHELTSHIEHDPLIAARVLALANAAAQRTRNIPEIKDIYAATSLIGIGNVRKLALNCSIAGFADDIAYDGMTNFWKHSVSTGLCCEEVASHTGINITSELAIISGLLHDVGQLWLYYFYAGDFRSVCELSLSHGTGIEQAEIERFGMDHTTIGSWLAEHWKLPPDICNAIRYHHTPDEAPDEPLVQVLHIAEILSNALNLADQNENRVGHISEHACKKLGLVWDDNIEPMLGRIDARSRHANALFL
jgi:HD-like signal output (HDOD) protein